MADLPALVEHANHIEIAGRMMDRFPHPYTTADGISFLEMAIQQHPVNLMAIDIEGEAAGGIGLHPMPDVYRRNMELGYWLAMPYWGRGIMPEAVRQMVEYGFANWDVDRIFARPFGSNKASQKVLEKSGFLLEARFEKTVFKNGSFEDELVYAIRRKG